MAQLQIHSPVMKDIFETKFNSNQDKFIEFIATFIKDNKKVVDSYFQKKDKSTFVYKKLDPMKNYYKISVDNIEAEMTNPYKDVKDSAVFAKKLRENNYR